MVLQSRRLLSEGRFRSSAKALVAGTKSYKKITMCVNSQAGWRVLICPCRPLHAATSASRSDGGVCSSSPSPPANLFSQKKKHTHTQNALRGVCIQARESSYYSSGAWRVDVSAADSIESGHPVMIT